MKQLRLTITFYKSFAFASWVITVACAIIAYTYGIETFAALFWFKVITLALFFFFINSYKREEFYYFKNLGSSKLTLWISALLFDLILFIVFLLISSKIR